MSPTAVRQNLPGPVAEALAVPADGPFVLQGYATNNPSLVEDRDGAEHDLANDLSNRLDDLHDRCMADGTRSLLVVLQGLDGSGKSGTIKHVGRLLNPVGVHVAAFKEPGGTEEREHFLERIKRELPDRGHVAFFDRSHYEDVIVPLATGELDAAAIAERIVEIEEFERALVADGTSVLKCLLHISYDEQRERFLRRLRRPDKQWKFAQSDVQTRRQWDSFQAAYADVIGRTSFDVTPWYVVPADRKWYRNWVVGSLVAEYLAAFDSAYPAYGGDVDAMRHALEAPR